MKIVSRNQYKRNHEVNQNQNKEWRGFLEGVKHEEKILSNEMIYKSNPTGGE